MGDCTVACVKSSSLQKQLGSFSHDALKSSCSKASKVARFRFECGFIRLVLRINLQRPNVGQALAGVVAHVVCRYSAGCDDGGCCRCFFTEDAGIIEQQQQSKLMDAYIQCIDMFSVVC